MTNGKIIKTIGIAVTVIGFGVNILTDWVNEKKMDERIEEKVNEALAKWCGIKKVDSLFSRIS